MFAPKSSDWEAFIVAAITEELGQLEYLIKDKSDLTEKNDIHAQVSRLCGLTDLAHNEAIPFAESTRLQIRELNDLAMRMIRTTLDSTPPSDEHVEHGARGGTGSF